MSDPGVVSGERGLELADDLLGGYLPRREGIAGSESGDRCPN